MSLIKKWEDFEKFPQEEFTCKCGCGRAEMDLTFISELQHLRDYLGFPLIINSGFRCPEHNNLVSGSGFNGPHTTGKAADIRIMGGRALALLTHISECAYITGVGISQKGKHSGRYIHLDMLVHNASRPRPWVWTY